MAFNGDAYREFIHILNSIGFHNNGEIAREVRKMVTQGITDINQIELGLRNTDAWKTRFAGNIQREKNGLNELSVADYLSTEDAYQQIMHQAGLPAKFYDDPADFAKFIGNGLSPNELQSRVAIAEDIKNREDPNVLNELAKRGISHGDYMAYILDPKRGMDVIQKKYQSALVSAAADAAGVHVKTAYANKLASMGISEDQAAQGFAQVGQIAEPLEKLADIYGEDYTQKDALKEVFEGNAASARKRQKLISQEESSFAGSSGTGQSSLTKGSAGAY